MPNKNENQKPLSQQQIKYMRERLTALRNQKVAAIEAEYKEESLDQVMDREIRANRVKLDPEKLRHASRRTDLVDVLIFKKFDGGEEAVKKALCRKDGAEMDARTLAVRSEMAKILDQVMLGDSVQALRMLEEFSGKSF